jgi:hypothetical protein
MIVLDVCLFIKSFSIVGRHILVMIGSVRIKDSKLWKLAGAAIVPLTYTLSSEAPFQMIGLPTLKSEMSSQPNIYWLVKSRLVNVSQTFDTGAFISRVFLTISCFMDTICTSLYTLLILRSI